MKSSNQNLGLEKNMVHELDTVVLTRDLAASGIVAGDIGVVAHLYADNSVAEVEFVSGAGHGLRPLLAHASCQGTTLAVETLPITELGSYRRTESESGVYPLEHADRNDPDNIRPVGAREILHARPLETA